ncbi:MAG: hypothetical protein AB1555_18560 [Nitrospirota bacterium]
MSSTSRPMVEHSAELVDHILYLEGKPNMDKVDRVTHGTGVQAFSKQISSSNSMAWTCFAKPSRTAPKSPLHHSTQARGMVAESGEHVDWFETQVWTIKRAVLDNYLADQTKK